MPKPTIPAGAVHAVPPDVHTALAGDANALAAWQTLTPLARNEWICWVMSVKKAETRSAHIARLLGDLKAGKRRPCCWYGCVHRPDKPVSPSVQNLVLNKRKGKRESRA